MKRKPVFRLHALPAEDGDALILTWGECDSDLHHMVVDLGRANTFQTCRRAIADLKQIDVFVLTHIDADHISGALEFLTATERGGLPQVRDVWFNSYLHAAQASGAQQPLLKTNPEQVTRSVNPAVTRAKDSGSLASLSTSADYELRSIKQGNKFATLVQNSKLPINGSFSDLRVSWSIDQGPPQLKLSGLTVTLLSPDDSALERLAGRWKEDEHSMRTARPRNRGSKPWSVDEVHRLSAVPFEADTSVTNGSSIAFLAEFKGSRVLLGGDAHAKTLVSALQRLNFSPENPLPLTCFKLAHHGSAKNTSIELLRLIDCPHFVISTSGQGRHGHPDEATIARLMFHTQKAKHLIFNYPHRRRWVEVGVAHEFGCKMTFGSAELGMMIDLLEEPYSARCAL